MVKLPVFETTGNALAASFKFAWPLLPFYLVLQLGIVGVMGAFSTVASVPGTGDAGLVVDTANVPLAIVAGIVVYIASVMLVVLTHRLIAGVEDPWRLSGPIVGYLLLTLGIVVMAAGIFGVAILITNGALLSPEPAVQASIGVLPALGVLVLYVVFIAVMFRVVLALPAAALERQRPLTIGLRASKGNVWRLIGGFFLVVTAITFLSLVLSLAAAAVGLISWPPADENIQGLANAFDLSDPDALGVLSLNIITNYFATVCSTAFLTYSLRALWSNVEQAE